MQSSESSASPKEKEGCAPQPEKPDSAPQPEKPSSASQTDKPRSGINPWLRVAVWLMRLIVGGVFIFSGFTKGVDPWGGLFKIEDYFAAWHVSATHAELLMVACGLALCEFILGIIVISGSWRRVGAWLAMLFMLFMTGLTFYIMLEDPVSDCGCFGDALILSNTMTFWKNVVLLTLTVLLVIYGRKCRGLFLPEFQWMPIVFSVIYLIVIEFVGYTFQPVIDFRPFPVDTDMVAMAEDAENGKMMFVYEKDGKQTTFGLDDIPYDDDSWKFVKRIDAEGDDSQPKLAVFEGPDDVTSDIFKDEGDQYIIVVSDPERYGISRGDMANRLYDYAKDNNADMFSIVAVPEDSVDAWKERVSAHYPVYHAEDTDLKMLVRGDGGFVMLRDGKILYKANVYQLAPYFPRGKQTVTDLLDSGYDGLLPKITIIWLIAMLVVYFLSRFAFFMTIFKLNKNKKSEK